MTLKAMMGHLLVLSWHSSDDPGKWAVALMILPSLSGEKNGLGLVAALTVGQTCYRLSASLEQVSHGRLSLLKQDDGRCLAIYLPLF
eukprot:m.129172 g.129172  ORF g.129172 m.129172 type:complete len:87 (+) comp37967_c0_seq1:615-875(+)